MDDESAATPLLAVPIEKLYPPYRNIKSHEDLPTEDISRIQHFFEHYKDLEKGKWVKVKGWGRQPLTRKSSRAPNAKQGLIRVCPGRRRAGPARMRRGRDGMMPIAAAPLLCGASRFSDTWAAAAWMRVWSASSRCAVVARLRGDEHQAADHLLVGAEDRRADAHQATVDLAVRDAHAGGAQLLQVGAEFIQSRPGRPRGSRAAPQHQVAQLVGRQIGQDGLAVAPRNIGKGRPRA